MFSPSDSSASAEPTNPITLEHFNIKTSRKKVRETYFGKIRDFSTFSVLEWVYLFLSFVGLTASLGLTIERVVSVNSYSSDFTFAVLLLLTIAFCFYYVIDAVLTERADELMVFVVSNSIVLVYCIANYALHERSTVKMIRLIVVCILSTTLIPTGLYQSYKYMISNNLVFNTVGAVTQLQKGCKIYFLCSTLLKFDLQLQLSMLILVMGSMGTSMDLTQELILGFGVVLTLIFVLLGFIGLRLENSFVMIGFFILGLFEPGYIIYKFHYAAVNDKDKATYESTFACGCFALVAWLALMIFTGYYTRFCFHKGLKEKMFGHTKKQVPVQDVAPSSAVDSNANASQLHSASQAISSPFLPLDPSIETVPTSINICAAEVHSSN